MSDPLMITVLAVLGLIICVMGLRMHAFVALVGVSIVAALAGGMDTSAALKAVQAGMGGTLGYIAVIVGLGSIFGALLEAGGGVQAVAQTILKKAGLPLSRIAMGVVGVLIAIPVFFDVALIILLPVVMSLASRTGKAPLYFGLPLLAGLAAAHAFIPPTPGPVAVADLLAADLGLVIMFGLVAGVPAMLVAGPLYTNYLDKRGLLGAAVPKLSEETGGANESAAVAAVVAILLPLALIVAGTLLPQSPILQLLGHPFVALIIGCGLAWALFRPADGTARGKLNEAIAKSLEPAGAVVLVTGAGGAFKQVLVDTGAGAALAQAAAGLGLAPIVAGFVLAVLVRVAQGSATVAMITAAGLMGPMLETVAVTDTTRALCVIAIAAGATAFSHVNDSGFWLVNRYFNLSMKETLRSWTVGSALVGFTGFAGVLILSVFVG